MTIPLHDILSRADEGESVADICAALNLSGSRVYGVLREHRPDRERSPRPRTSDLPHVVRGLAGLKIKQSRIAFLLGVSRTYVSRILKDQSHGR